MDTNKLEKHLAKLEKVYERHTLLAILTVPKAIVPGTFLRHTQGEVKSKIQDCLPAFGTTTIEQMAVESHELANHMDEVLKDTEISGKLRELIEVATEEHTLGGLGLILDELKAKQKAG